MNDPLQPAPVVVRRRRWLWGLLAGLLLLGLGLLAAGGWLWHSAAAQTRLLQALPGLEVEGLQGRATGGAFAIERLRWRSAELSIEVDGLRWQDLSWRWRPHPGAWVGLVVAQPQSRAVRVTRTATTPAPPAEPLQLPDSLRLPLAVSLQGLAIGSVQLDGKEMLSALGADVEVGADGGARHRVDALKLSLGKLALSGELSVSADGDQPLAARLALATPAGQPLSWQAVVQAQGPLRRLALEADLKTEAGAALEAKAIVTPLARWPLAALALQARDLDLSVLAPGLPQTALSGSAELGDVTSGAPLQLKLALDNARAGAWDAGRLPVRSAHGVLQGRPDQAERIDFDGWVVELGAKGGGQLGVAGHWQGSRIELALQLGGVQAAQLDTRAPPAAIDGTLALTVDGPALPGSGAAAQALQGRIRAVLRGRVAPPTPPLALSGTIGFALPGAGAMTVEVSGLEASAGKARASATFNARRDAAGAWALKSDGRLEQVDLATWWRAAGASELNGRWQTDLQLPAAAAGSLIDSLRGVARIDLQDSRWSGVPLSGRLSLDAGAQRLAVDALLAAAGNRLQLVGGGAAAKPGHSEWRVDLQAPTVQTLRPLLARVPGAEGWLPAAGGLQATGTIAGAWPALRSEGQLQIDALRLPQGQLNAGRLRWSVAGLALDSPLEIDAGLSGLVQAGRRVDRLQARLDGSLREHRLQLQAESPLRPPAWIDALAPLAAAGKAAVPGSALRLQLQGRWLPAAPAAPLGAGEWRGRLASLRAGPRQEGAAPWLALRDLDALLRLDAASRPVEARLAPGRVEAFGAALAWQQALWQAPERPGGAAGMALDAQLEPLQLAPILARLQPDLGWQGDLVIGGRARVRSGAQLDADLTIERQGGDLGLNLGEARHDLGLSALRLALSARGGRWQLQQALEGRQLGVLAGSQTLQAAADALFPPAQSVLQGGVTLRVPDAGIYALWLPPGWRLGGALGATLALGGVLEAPTFSGELTGERLAARNNFEGVNLGDGSVRVRFDQRQAIVEKIHFAGGDGALDLNGRVDFAEAPQAALSYRFDRFRALDRVDRRVALSGEGTIGLRAGRLALRGRLAIDEGLIDVSADDAPSLSDDVLVVGRKDAQGRPLPQRVDAETTRPSALASTDIDLRLSLGDALRLRGRGLDTLLRGQLQITTTAAGKLSVRGVVNTAEGSYTAYGQNLAIERGAISFGGDATNPRLDILALRADIDNRIGVIVSGSAASPRVRLYSDPDLPEIDQLTWLLTGQPPQGQGRNESALLQRAALALLAGDRGASDEGFLQKLGIDQLGVGRSDGGETVVTIGKQLSKRLSIVYEKGLSAAGGTWSLLYRIAGRTTLRARTGVENAVEVIWSWRWD